MLYLTRKIGESVVINSDIEVTVIEVRGRSVRLGFNFPSNASVLRREIFERVQAENREAADAASVLEELTAPKPPENKD
ncbi:MAG: carbon storage regulator CsrA [Alphaproteobacteria bacterium]|jgi:carbon storage regulator|nr:carbon storage regulator CsrA [Alphaproteobacteria bacterium]